MWKVALGIAVLLRAGGAPAAENDTEQSAVHVDCPSDSADADCVAGEAIVPEAPVVAPAAPTAAAIAPSPTAFATVHFRNDVGKKLRLVEAEFALDGEKLPVVLNSAEQGKSYIITSGAVKPGSHVVSARLTYRGDRGVFSYMKGYKLNVRSQQVLAAPADRPVSFTVVGSENKGMTVPLERSVVVSIEEDARRR